MRQTSRISSASGESSGQARDNTIAPTTCASVSISFASRDFVEDTVYAGRGCQLIFNAGGKGLLDQFGLTHGVPG